VFWNNRRSFDVFRLDRMNLISRLTPDEIAISSLAAIVIVRARLAVRAPAEMNLAADADSAPFAIHCKKLIRCAARPSLGWRAFCHTVSRARQTEQAASSLSHKPNVKAEVVVTDRLGAQAVPRANNRPAGLRRLAGCE